MVNHLGTTLDATFAALADPTRRAILARLAETPDASVGELAEPFDISAPAISRHLRVLEGAGLLARRREGRVHHCRFVPGPLRTAAEWMEHYRAFWTRRLDALQRYLEQSEETERNEEESWSKTQRQPARRRRSASHARSKPRVSGSSGPGRTRSS